MKRSAFFLTVLLAAAVLCGCRVDLQNPYASNATDAPRTTASAVPDEPSRPTATTAATTAQTAAPTTAATSGSAPVTDAPQTEAPLPEPEPADTDLVLLSRYLPEAVLDVRYATANNFTGQVIYEDANPRLRYGTVKKLRAVCQRLEAEGYRLVIWDAWRPAAAQWKLWNICPDPTYVSNPNKGYSSHTRGGTVDISLIRADGTAVEMPTDFDDFTEAADLDFSDVSAEAAKNAQLLQDIMTACGFKPYRAEWWHFSDTDSYDVVEAIEE